MGNENRVKDIEFSLCSMLYALCKLKWPRGPTFRDVNTYALNIWPNLILGAGPRPITLLIAIGTDVHESLSFQEDCTLGGQPQK